MNYLLSPLVFARTHATTQDGISSFTQYDVARDLGKSQQYIQKMEEGLSNTPPEDICYYYDTLVPIQDRKDYLKSLLSLIATELVPGSFALQKRYLEGPIPGWAAIYTLWVSYSRAILPVLSPILDEYATSFTDMTKSPLAVEDTIYQMVSRIIRAQDDKNMTELDTPIYTLSKYLRVNPFIIQRWQRLSKNCPPSLAVAIHQTGRSKIGRVPVSKTVVAGTIVDLNDLVD